MDGIKWLVSELDRRKYLDELDAMDELDAEIVIALADCNMNATEVARRLYMHRNTVIYHVRKILKATGKNILNFYDLCEMVPVAKMRFSEVARR